MQKHWQKLSNGYIVYVDYRNGEPICWTRDSSFSDERNQHGLYLTPLSEVLANPYRFTGTKDSFNA